MLKNLLSKWLLGLSQEELKSLSDANMLSALAVTKVRLHNVEEGADGQLIVCDASGKPQYVALSGDGTISNSGVLSVPGVGGSMDAVKVTNTLTGNMGSVTPSIYSWFTTTDILGSSAGNFTFATNGVTPTFTGLAEISFNCFIDGNDTRANVGFRWKHNGSVGPWCAHTYIRNTGGHNQTSANFTTIIPTTASSIIQIESAGLGTGSSDQTSAAGNTEFTLKRIS